MKSNPLSPVKQNISDNPRAPECVILLHGLARTRRSMAPLAKRLEREGYLVWNEGYPSTRMPIETIVRRYVLPAVAWAEGLGTGKIHFVAHSMGGILVREYLQTRTLPAGSRIVMISPPNGGSEVADRLKDFLLYRWIMGPAGQELGTSPDSLPHRLKPVSAHIGIIAGTSSLEPWFSRLIPGPDDGKVSVESAKLPEMNDFLTVAAPHGTIMRTRCVIDQVVFYLKNGRFTRPEDYSPDIPA